MIEANVGEVLDGKVEVDGAYRKPATFRDDRIGRRRALNQTGRRHVVFSVRGRNRRTLPFVFKSEAEAIATIGHYVSPSALNATVSRQLKGYWQRQKAA